jgi:hypothetical protein
MRSSVLVLVALASLLATPALPCLNETTLAHDEVARMVKRAQQALEKGMYAEAARRAHEAIGPLERRVEIGEGEAWNRAEVPRWKDRLLLTKAHTIVVAAVIRSNATVDDTGKAVDGDGVGSFIHAYQDIVMLKRMGRPTPLLDEVEAEVMARSSNMRAVAPTTQCAPVRTFGPSRMAAR